MRSSRKKCQKPPFWSFLAKKGYFRQFLAKMAKTVKIIKKALGTILSRLQALTGTDARTDATSKVSTTSRSRDQKVFLSFLPPGT